MPSRTTIWLRRAALMATAGILIGIPTTLLVRGGNERAEEAQGLELSERIRDRGLGIRLATPEGWRERKRQGVLTVRSPDRSVGIRIAAPGPAADADEILDTARDVIRDRYRGARVRSRFRGRIGDRPAQVTVFTAIDPQHRTPLVIDVIVVRGQGQAHLIQAFTDARGGALARTQGEAVLRSLRFVD